MIKENKGLIATERIEAAIRQYPDNAGFLYASIVTAAVPFVFAGQSCTSEDLPKLEQAYENYLRFDELTDCEDYGLTPGKTKLVGIATREGILVLALRHRGLEYTEAVLTRWIKSHIWCFTYRDFIVRAQIRALLRKSGLAKKDMIKALIYFKKYFASRWPSEETEEALKKTISTLEEKSPSTFQEITDIFAPITEEYNLTSVLLELFEAKDGRPIIRNEIEKSESSSDNAAKAKETEVIREYLLLCLTDALEIEEVRLSSLTKVTSRADPIISAIDKHKKKFGEYPEDLTVISKEKVRTGLWTRPHFDYQLRKNYYELRVYFGRGAFGHTLLLYRPEEGRSEYSRYQDISPGGSDAMIPISDGWVILVD